MSRINKQSHNLAQQRRNTVMRAQEQKKLADKNAGTLIQPKLEVSQSGDKEEEEADHVARKVVEGGNSGAIPPSVNTMQPKHESGEESGKLYASADLQNKLDGSKGSGSSLDKGTKNEMETKMGTDLSDVKIHTDSNAHEMSENINAKAFTHGQDIYFKQGNYNTSSTEGKKLLAHELTHTQQLKKGLSRKIQR